MGSRGSSEELLNFSTDSRGWRAASAAVIDSPPMRHLRLLVTSLCVLILGACASAPADDPAGVTATVEAFYGAMKAGDNAAAMQTLAADAVFIEGGRLETRAEYESNHLPADIEFERAVTGKRSPLQITFNGNTAWVIATTEFEGTFEGSPVNFVSAQLMVLTRDNGPWTIRTVHWSSYRR
jgi:ketosteroid isomerase-like protein